MCGIAGILQPGPSEGAGRLGARVKAMADTLRHRGPDDAGVWTDEKDGVALGNRRLAILDLSPQGHLPMSSASGRYVIAYNGEVYNFNEIRARLVQENPDQTWRGHSDTEVMLAAIEAWGLEPAVQAFVGMFAFALWDRQARVLFLVRDRMGEKPLYYGWAGKAFLFGSELKAFRAHPEFSGQVDRPSLSLFLRYGYVPSPHCIYSDVRKLLPGSILRVTLDGGQRFPTPVPFWSVKQAVQAGKANPFRGTEEEAADALEVQLKTAIRGCMESDVPLGVFLSGGIDSSTVTALMQSMSAKPIRSFTIGFEEAGYDEAPYAAAVAKHLGTEHTQLYVTAVQAREVIARLPSMYDEPFADSSQIPTYLVSAMARGHVTVSLSGDGGDELFGGYVRYIQGARLWRRVKRIPRPIRAGVARLLRRRSPDEWNKSRLLRLVVNGRMRAEDFGNYVHKAARVLESKDAAAFYQRLVSVWDDPDELLARPGPAPNVAPALEPGSLPPLRDLREAMMYGDMVTYLPDDILVKVDRASMAASLESRAPLLDHRLVELAWRLPARMKVHKGIGKRILRRVLHRYVPRELIERPKAGFAIPLDGWLRGPLKAWAEDLLDPVRMRSEGFLRPEPIWARWQEHLSGRRNWFPQLWAVLMFQAWLRQNARHPQEPTSGRLAAARAS